jgi:hypothetical protein
MSRGAALSFEEVTRDRRSSKLVMAVKFSLVAQEVTAMFPFLLIVIGIAVLLFGKRLSVLGAAVGALLGFVLVGLLPSPELWLQFAVVIGLALLGFFMAAFARGLIDVVILVIGALAGAGIALAFLNLFNLDWGLANWLLAVVGGVAGFMLIRSLRDSKNDWGMIILSSLIGSLLVTRGVTSLIPSMRDTVFTSLLLVALVAFGMIYGGGLLSGRKDTAAPAAQVPPAAEDKPTPPPAA